MGIYTFISKLLNFWLPLGSKSRSAWDQTSQIVSKFYFERVTQREGEIEKQSYSICPFTCPVATKARLEVKSLGLWSGPSTWATEPQVLDHLLLLPQECYQGTGLEVDYLRLDMCSDMDANVSGRHLICYCRMLASRKWTFEIVW